MLLIDSLIQRTEAEINEFNKIKAKISDEIEQKRLYLDKVEKDQAEARDMLQYLKAKKNGRTPAAVIIEEPIKAKIGKPVPAGTPVKPKRTKTSPQEYLDAATLLTEEKGEWSTNDLMELLGVSREAVAWALSHSENIVRVTPGKTKRNVKYTVKGIKKKEPEEVKLRVTTLTDPRELKDAR